MSLKSNRLGETLYQETLADFKSLYLEAESSALNNASISNERDTSGNVTKSTITLADPNEPGVVRSVSMDGTGAITFTEAVSIATEAAGSDVKHTLTNVNTSTILKSGESLDSSYETLSTSREFSNGDIVRDSFTQFNDGSLSQTSEFEAIRNGRNEDASITMNVSSEGEVSFKSNHEIYATSLDSDTNTTNLDNLATFKIANADSFDKLRGAVEYAGEYPEPGYQHQNLVTKILDRSAFDDIKESLSNLSEINIMEEIKEAGATVGSAFDSIKEFTSEVYNTSFSDNMSNFANSISAEFSNISNEISKVSNFLNNPEPEKTQISAMLDYVGESKSLSPEDLEFLKEHIGSLKESSFPTSELSQTAFLENTNSRDAKVLEEDLGMEMGGE